jgi:hypothetical protein
LVLLVEDSCRISDGVKRDAMQQVLTCMRGVVCTNRFGGEIARTPQLDFTWLQRGLQSSTTTTACFYKLSPRWMLFLLFSPSFLSLSPASKKFKRHTTIPCASHVI